MNFLACCPPHSALTYPDIKTSWSKGDPGVEQSLAKRCACLQIRLSPSEELERASLVAVREETGLLVCWASPGPEGAVWVLGSRKKTRVCSADLIFK